MTGVEDEIEVTVSGSSVKKQTEMVDAYNRALTDLQMTLIANYGTPNISTVITIAITITAINLAIDIISLGISLSEIPELNFTTLQDNIGELPSYTNDTTFITNLYPEQFTPVVVFPRLEEEVAQSKVVEGLIEKAENAYNSLDPISVRQWKEAMGMDIYPRDSIAEYVKQTLKKSKLSGDNP